MTPLIMPELVQLNVDAKDWRDAIYQSGALLVKKHLITKNYLDSVIKIAEETGPYIVFMPHVALSHAKTEDGALGDGIGLTVLRNPVLFGNKSNDPVKYIFTLSSLKPDGHLEQMARLVNLLSKKNFFQRVARATTVQEIIKVIDDVEGEK